MRWDDWRLCKTPVKIGPSSNGTHHDESSSGTMALKIRAKAMFRGKDRIMCSGQFSVWFWWAFWNYKPEQSYEDDWWVQVTWHRRNTGPKEKWNQETWDLWYTAKDYHSWKQDCSEKTKKQNRPSDHAVRGKTTLCDCQFVVVAYERTRRQTKNR